MECECCQNTEAEHTTVRMGIERHTCDHCYRNCLAGKPCTRTDATERRHEEVEDDTFDEEVESDDDHELERASVFDF